jgi:hypothetical protein
LAHFETIIRKKHGCRQAIATGLIALVPLPEIPHRPQTIADGGAKMAAIALQKIPISNVRY